jgi:lysophospholipase L1-like esterase
MNISLIGDSIRMHSQNFTVDYLPEEWHVSFPLENCESSNEIVTNISKWLSEPCDIIHINCGLHDIRFNQGASQKVSSITQYQANLKVIFDYLSRLNCKVIWATSTPFNENVHNHVKESKRYLADIIQYNTVSTELAIEYGFAINDLYKQLTDIGYDNLLLDDGLHFNKSGNSLIGQLVSESIWALARQQS